MTSVLDFITGAIVGGCIGGVILCIGILINRWWLGFRASQRRNREMLREIRARYEVAQLEHLFALPAHERKEEEE